MEFESSNPSVEKVIGGNSEAVIQLKPLAAGKYVMAPAGSGAAARAAIDQGAQLVVVQFGQFFRAALNAYLEAARPH